MNVQQEIRNWSASHHPWWLISVRILLGLTLFVKGFMFMKDSTLLPSLFKNSEIINITPWIALTITWLHLLCGVLIVIGLFTRLATLIMLPVLITAVIIVNIPSGDTPELIFSIFICLLLAFFFIEGSGPLSTDNYLSQKTWRL